MLALMETAPSKYTILKVLRLSPQEQRILHVVESLKLAGTVARISTLAKTPRTSTLHTLRKLTKWDLLRQINAGKKKHWMANRILR